MLNRVEIKGRVGAVRVTKLSETSMARMTVATDYAYIDNENNPVIETTWHTVVLWEGSAASAETIESLAKGDAVHIVGRIRNQRYTDSEGNDKVFPEIVAHQFEKMSNE